MERRMTSYRERRLPTSAGYRRVTRRKKKSGKSSTANVADMTTRMPRREIGNAFQSLN